MTVLIILTISGFVSGLAYTVIGSKTDDQVMSGLGLTLLSFSGAAGLMLLILGAFKNL